MFRGYWCYVKNPPSQLLAEPFSGLTVTVVDKDKRMIKAFGKRLQSVRIVAGISDASLAAGKLGIEAPRYRKYERGEAIPPLPVLALICTMFNTTSDFLLFGRIDRTHAAVMDKD